MLNQLRTMRSLDLTMVNEMLREVYANEILPKKAKKNPLRGYRSEAAMTTTTTAKRSDKNRDIGEVVCHNCKAKGHYANKCPAKKPLPGDTTTKWCSLHKTRSHSDNECMAQQATPQSRHPVSALLSTVPLPQRLVHLPSWQAHRFRPLRKAGYNYWSTAAAYLVWWTP